MVLREKEYENLAEICRKNRITRLVLFGSQSRGDATSSSDIDLIADLAEDASLLDMIRIEQEISDALGRPVDLMTEKSISPYILERIQDDRRVIYEAS